MKRTRKALRLRKDLKGCELIFVNDGSIDESENLLKKEIRTNKDIVLINTSRNFGDNIGCYFEGLRVAKGDTIIMGIDTDLQDPPEIINPLIDEFNKKIETEIVISTRIQRHGESKIKLMIAKLGYIFINFISNVNVQGHR